MRKIVMLGALTGAVALTGLAGAAYAADGGTATASATTVSAAKPGPIPGGKIITCYAKQIAPGEKGKLPGFRTFKGAKIGAVVVKPDGKGKKVFLQKPVDGKDTLPLPPGADTVKIDKNGVVTSTGGTVHCTQLPAGSTPPGLPPLPPK